MAVVGLWIFSPHRTKDHALTKKLTAANFVRGSCSWRENDRPQLTLAVNVVLSRTITSQLEQIVTGSSDRIYKLRSNVVLFLELIDSSRTGTITETPFPRLAVPESSPTLRSNYGVQSCVLRPETHQVRWQPARRPLLSPGSLFQVAGEPSCLCFSILGCKLRVLIRSTRAYPMERVPTSLTT